MAISILSACKKSLLALSVAALGMYGSSANADAPFHPFAESMDIDPDYQWFASVDMQEMEELSARKRASKGWFIGYDRLHFGMDRPDIGAQASQIDMTWGNRWDFGFMSEKNSGLLFSFTHVSGPNVFNDVRIPRLVLPPNIGEDFPAAFPLFPLDPNYGDGTILERQSVNQATFSSFEANKTWRLEPYRYGGILEPLAGFRYIQFNDYATNDNYEGINLDNDTTFEIESLTRLQTRTDNRMVLGQLGYRYFSTVKRMTFSNELRVFAGQNFQTQGSYARTYQNLIPSTVLTHNGVFSGRENSEAVVGMDVRMEAAMQLTKAFVVRAGAQLIYIGRGVWRGANPGFGDQNAVDQDLVSPAFTFGAAFNR